MLSILKKPFLVFVSVCKILVKLVFLFFGIKSIILIIIRAIILQCRLGLVNLIFFRGFNVEVSPELLRDLRRLSVNVRRYCLQKAQILQRGLNKIRGKSTNQYGENPGICQSTSSLPIVHIYFIPIVLPLFIYKRWSWLTNARIFPVLMCWFSSDFIVTSQKYLCLLQPVSSHIHG